MCGIAGFYGLKASEGDMAALLGHMAGAMSRRGPDDTGAWADPARGIGLAHARLSILDLSAAGAQPMFSSDGRYGVVYNGEIYNHPEIRKRMESDGSAPEGGWRGSSDTETLLEAVSAYGLRKALDLFTGMFAFALWDAHSRELTLVRDRMGIKPLYYGLAGNSLVFGSTLAPMARHPHWSPEIDRNALALYLGLLYIPTPYSIYRGIKKLPQGSLLTVGEDDPESGRLPEPQKYWSVFETASSAKKAPFKADEEEAAGELKTLLKDSVRLRLLSDVPLGAFLSGGVDSSLVVALMQELSDRPVKTFTIKAEGNEYDESCRAAEIARILGTDHTEREVSPQEALDIIPKLPEFYDEPFADSSQIPTCLVSETARTRVTVSLSGDGGDELFGGYNRYLLAPGLWNKVSALPAWARCGLARLLDSRLTVAAGAVYRLSDLLRPSARRQVLVEDKIRKVAAAAEAEDRAEFFHRLATYWMEPERLVPGATGAASLFTETAEQPRIEDYAEWMMAMDQATYLPDDILTKVDRASMAYSLEARVPLIDHRVVEFSHTLPQNMKVTDVGKKLLRKILYRYLPRDTVERPKQGFGVPMETWLRGPLRDWTEELLRRERLQSQGLLDPTPVRRAWETHLSGKSNLQHHLWAVLMFQAWMENQP